MCLSTTLLGNIAYSKKITGKWSGLKDNVLMGKPLFGVSRVWNSCNWAGLLQRPSKLCLWNCEITSQEAWAFKSEQLSQRPDVDLASLHALINCGKHIRCGEPPEPSSWLLWFSPCVTLWARTSLRTPLMGLPRVITSSTTMTFFFSFP